MKERRQKEEAQRSAVSGKKIKLKVKKSSKDKEVNINFRNFKVVHVEFVAKFCYYMRGMPPPYQEITGHGGPSFYLDWMLRAENPSSAEFPQLGENGRDCFC